MRQGRFAALIALVVLFALALGTQASANQWYIEDGPHGHRDRIPAGESVEVPTEGKINLKIRLRGRHGTIDAECAVNGDELLSDPTSETAFAQTSALTFYSCGNGVDVTSVLFPWSGELAGSCQPCTITRPESLELSVGGIDYGQFTGEVAGRIGDFDPPIKDDIDHIFKLMGKTGGALSGEEGTVALGGVESFGLKADGDQADGEPNTASIQEEESAAEARRNRHGDPDGD